MLKSRQEVLKWGKKQEILKWCKKTRILKNIFQIFFKRFPNFFQIFSKCFFFFTSSLVFGFPTMLKESLHVIFPVLMMNLIPALFSAFLFYIFVKFTSCLFLLYVVGFA